MIRVRNLKNGTTTISGLDDGDLRLIANAIDAGAWQAANQNPARADAVCRFASALRTAATFQSRIGNSDLINSCTDLDALYEEAPR
jgi:hypothetical protein